MNLPGRSEDWTVKCFHHLERDAIGVCLACQRGLCPECAVDLSRALACRGPCQHEARRLLDLRDFSFAQPSLQDTILRRNTLAYQRSGLYSIIFGVSFIAFGYIQGDVGLLYVMGIAATGFGVWSLVTARLRQSTNQFRLCPHCGYNITGNTTGKCPECGKIA